MLLAELVPPISLATSGSIASKRSTRSAQVGGSMVAPFARVSRRGVCSGMADGLLDLAYSAEPLKLHRQLAELVFGSAATLQSA